MNPPEMERATANEYPCNEHPYEYRAYGETLRELRTEFWRTLCSQVRER